MIHRYPDCYSAVVDKIHIDENQYDRVYYPVATESQEVLGVTIKIHRQEQYCMFVCDSSQAFDVSYFYGRKAREFSFKNDVDNIYCYNGGRMTLEPSNSNLRCRSGLCFSPHDAESLAEAVVGYCAWRKQNDKLPLQISDRALVNRNRIASNETLYSSYQDAKRAYDLFIQSKYRQPPKKRWFWS